MAVDGFLSRKELVGSRSTFLGVAETKPTATGDLAAVFGERGVSPRGETRVASERGGGEVDNYLRGIINDVLNGKKRRYQGNLL